MGEEEQTEGAGSWGYFGERGNREQIQGYRAPPQGDLPSHSLSSFISLDLYILWRGNHIATSPAHSTL